MDEKGMKLYVGKIWAKPPGALFKKRAMFVQDQFRAHTTESITFREGMNRGIVIIPGGVTNQLQHKCFYK